MTPAVDPAASCRRRPTRGSLLRGLSQAPGMTDAAEADRAAGRESSPTRAAADLLAATRTGEEPDPSLARLEHFDHGALAPVRENRRRALAFWTNLYNAATQLLLDRRPALYESPLRGVRFFRAEAVAVAGRGIGLDAIEHGILRGGRSKYGLGYLPRLPRPFERRYAVPRDPRVHFALNCGAESCPAIRTYGPDRVDAQLDRSTAAYLDGRVEYDADAGVARVPRLFLWYRGDFGGADGIRAWLREYDAIPDDAAPSLRYAPWDWTKAAGKFA